MRAGEGLEFGEAIAKLAVLSLTRFRGQRGAAAGRRKTKPMETKTKRRSFDEAFKRDAVALLLKGDKPIKLLATDLGVSHWNLRDWRKRYGPAAPVRRSEALEIELRALRRENQHLRAQRDILKKTLGILVEPGANGLPT